MSERNMKGVGWGKEQYIKTFSVDSEVDSLLVQQPIKNSVSWES